MPRLNGTGPDGKEKGSGRGLGLCKKTIENNKESAQTQLGKGLGCKRNSGGGVGKGKRLRYNESKN